MGGRARAARVLPFLLAAVSLLAWTSSASAISRRQADRIAMHVLKPQRLNATEGVVLLGLPRPLPAGDTVGVAKPGRTFVRPIGRKEWLFWLDPAYGEGFAHRSTVLLLSNSTGKVAAERRIEWWPLINGKRPAFFTGEPQRESGRDRGFRVYAHLPASAFDTAERAARNHAHRRSAPIAHASNAFTDSCLVMAGDYAEFPKDFSNIETYFKGFGVTPYRMKNDEDLGTFVKNLPGSCKDVILYFSGHEGKEGGIIAGNKKVRRKKLETVNGKVKVGWEETEEEAIIPISGITGAIKANATRTFKVIVDACYSGLVVNAIEKNHLTNVLIAVASSGATEKSWALSWGGFTAGLIEGMKEGEAAAKERSSGDPVATLIEEGTKHPHGVFSGSWKTSSSLYSCGKEEVLFNNWDGGAVANGGVPPTFKTGSKTYCLVSIVTYHWDKEEGTASAGTIGLRYSGGELGPYQAVGSPGENLVPNANWTVTLSTTTPVILKPDSSYTCEDSSPATWAQNEESGGAGFCEVRADVATPLP